MRKHYEANKEKYITAAKASNKKIEERNRSYILEYLTQHSCQRCGETNILALEFDHLRDKSINISDLIRRSCGLETLKEELDKCQVLCGSCHRIKTHEQQNTYRWKFYQRNFQR